MSDKYIAYNKILAALEYSYMVASHFKKLYKTLGQTVCSVRITRVSVDTCMGQVYNLVSSGISPASFTLNCSYYSRII